MKSSAKNWKTHITPLKWDWTWTEDNTVTGHLFRNFGITGVALPKYDNSLCSGCSPIAQYGQHPGSVRIQGAAPAQRRDIEWKENAGPARL